MIKRIRAKQQSIQQTMKHLTVFLLLQLFAGCTATCGYQTGCETKICPKWTQCIMKKPLCKKLPCYDVATCVRLPNPCLNVVCGAEEVCVAKTVLEDGKKVEKPLCIKLCRDVACRCPVLTGIASQRVEKCKFICTCLNENPCEKFTCPSGETCKVLFIYCGPACTFNTRPVCVGKPSGGEKCPDGSKPLTKKGVKRFCGRGGERCPPGSKCINDRGDRFAICCRNGRKYK